MDDGVDPLVRYFEERAHRYDRQLPLEAPALRAAARAARPLGGADVADLAAGTGGMSAALLARGPRPGSLTLVDASPRMLARARRRLAGARPGPRFVVADVRRTPLPGGSADVVTVAYLLHLLGPTERRAVLAEARRLLRPGGRLVAVVHASPGGTAGRAYRAGWRLLGRLAGDAVVGTGPLAGLAEEVRVAGFRVETTLPVRGAYRSEVVGATRP